MDVDGVPIYFIDNEYYFGHDQLYLDYSFDIERFSFFQRAVLEALGEPMDFRPGHPAPERLADRHDPLPARSALPALRLSPATCRTVFTIHNLKYQGIHGRERIADLMDLPDRFLTDDGVLKDGVPNFMKAGIVYADRVTTVSPTYAARDHD